MDALRESMKACVNYQLTDYLKECTKDQLDDIYCRLYADNIVGIKEKIAETLLIELEYRAMEDNTVKTLGAKQKVR